MKNLDAMRFTLESSRLFSPEIEVLSSFLSPTISQ